MTKNEEPTGERMMGVKHSFQVTINDWKIKALNSKFRSTMVRGLAAWIRGDGTPPEGMTRADLLLRPPQWLGWDWSLRCEVSIKALEDDRKMVCGALEDNVRAYARLKQRQKEWSKNDNWPADYPERVDAIAMVQAALFEFKDALDDEREAWHEWNVAAHNARMTLATSELEAAHTRFAAEEREARAANAPADDPSEMLARIDATTQDIRADTQVTRTVVTDKTKKASERGQKYGKKGAGTREPNKAVENALRKVHDLVKGGKKPLAACREVLGWKRILKGKTEGIEYQTPVDTLSGNHITPENLARRYRMKYPKKRHTL